MSLILRTIKGSPLTYQELDDNFTYVESLASGSASTLTEVLANGNSTSGQSITITSGDTLDINGTIDFTNSTIVGLNINPETLAQTLAVGNRTGGRDIIVDYEDTLAIEGGLVESYKVIESSGILDSGIIGQHIDARNGDLVMAVYPTPIDGQILKIIRTDNDTNNTLTIAASDYNFVYNGSIVSSFTLSIYESVTFIYSRIYDLWFQQK